MSVIPLKFEPCTWKWSLQGVCSYKLGLAGAMQGALQAGVYSMTPQGSTTEEPTSKAAFATAENRLLALQVPQLR